MFSIKFIHQSVRIFLIRYSIPLACGSIKIHLILNDDEGEPHTHPWNFVSFLALGAYKEWVDGKFIRHLPFSLVRRRFDQHHKISLYRIFGIKLPVLTVGRYSQKFVLCSLCKNLGYCRTEGRPSK